MANVLAPFGFRQQGFLAGFAPDYQQLPRAIQSTNTTKIFFGDPVSKSGAYIVQGGNATAIIEGIFYGCQYVDSTGQTKWLPYWPGAAATDAVGYIVSSPGAMFLVQALNTAIASTDIGRNIGFSIGTGSTVGAGLSGATIDQSTLGTTNTLPFQIVSLYGSTPGVATGLVPVGIGGQGNGSDNTTAFNFAIVSFNNQRFKTLTGVN